MKSFIVCMLVAVGASVASAQVLRPGKCDASIGPITDYNGAKYLGMWYEYSRSFIFNEAGSKCNTGYYTVINGTVALTNIQYYPLLKKRHQVYGVPAFNDGRNVGRFTVTYNTGPTQFTFDLLATDYENYSIVYGCNDLPLSHAMTLTVLTRERVPSEEVIKKAYDIVESFGIDSNILKKTDQEDCSYTPLQSAFENYKM